MSKEYIVTLNNATGRDPVARMDEMRTTLLDMGSAFNQVVFVLKRSERQDPLELTLVCKDEFAEKVKHTNGVQAVNEKPVSTLTTQPIL